MWNPLRNTKKIYLDHASSTSLDPICRQVMSDCEDQIKGANPSAVHTLGIVARRYVEHARESVAKSLSAHSDEIIFTGSGTESVALAIHGAVKNYVGTHLPHIITTSIEHSAVLENCRLLEKEGKAMVTYISINEKGIVNPKDVRDALRPETVLVSVMYANNEIGTIQPIEEIAKEIRHFKKIHSFSYPLFHTDACQAMNYLFTENIEKLGVDLLSFNGSKIYGPKGVGVLFKKRSVTLAPLYAGGGQEFGLRSGTENVSAIVGIGYVLLKTTKIKEKESARLVLLREYGIEKLRTLSQESGYEIIVNGDEKNRLPNNINISIAGISSELLVIELDAKGILVSERSACASDNDTGSHVIAMLRRSSNDTKHSNDSIRISMGRGTKKNDIDACIKALASILQKYKKWK
ncbi:MAG: cysteine desulfurase [Candidatus Pacebacteria bacterium]|jgi:cysteine desulfurase|nr:cysteine desulfurase [Candidatus Paceibacterota bacterium]